MKTPHDTFFRFALNCLPEVGGDAKNEKPGPNVRLQQKSPLVGEALREKKLRPFDISQSS
jgi:hypothetical protein